MSPTTSVPVEVDGRTLKLTNLNKVLYPEVGFTKGEVLDYYTRIAPVLLPHIAGRPMTLKRYPDGVDGQSFFAKNAPSYLPDWLHHVRLPSPGSTKDRDEVDYVIVDDLPSLVWVANLAALELHVPQWRVGPRGAPHPPDLMVFDLDPGAPATIVECCQVALLIRELLAADGLDAHPKTSGSKGLQLYVPVTTTAADAPSTYARAVAEQVSREHPEQVVFEMRRALRPGKVFVDWSQNNPAKTTIAPYSLRARARPTASTPLTWDEVDGGANGDDLVFTAPDLLARVERYGDLFADLAERAHPLPRR